MNLFLKNNEALCIQVLESLWQHICQKKTKPLVGQVCFA